MAQPITMVLTSPPPGNFSLFADVAVDTPIRPPGVFSYGVPSDLLVQVGQPVWVPLGRQPALPGIVVELSERPSPYGVRPIADVVGPDPLVTPDQIALARWIADEYLAPLYQTLALMQPPGSAPRAQTLLRLAPEIDLSSAADPVERRLVEVLSAGPQERRRVLAAAGRGAKAALDRLLRRGIVQALPALRPVPVRPRFERIVWLDLDQAAALAQLASLTPAQRELVGRLQSLTWPAREPAVRSETGASRARLQSLVRRGILRRTTERIEARRDPLAGHSVPAFPPLPLTADQAQALAAILAALDRGPWNVDGRPWTIDHGRWTVDHGRRGADDGLGTSDDGLWTVEGGRPAGDGGRRPVETAAEPVVFLIEGVTGSGKTEVYLRALAAARARGQQGIVLVPEIALTPQMIDRFVGRFPGRVAVLHSQLGRGEQYDEWQRIRSGGVDVVIGSRSAVFAPVPALGLIVVDEEHEWTYKQPEPPAYEARAVAIERARLTGATVVLGSATPDVISRYRAEMGQYRWFRLPQRIRPAGLPPVEVVDLRAELRAGNRSIFSRALDRALRRTLEAGEQAILFLNRRGAATFVQCRDCGQAVSCRRCELPLTYHSAADDLVCHRCNARRPLPHQCADCGSRRIKQFGLGTQRLEEETRLAYPGARVLRWDRDTTAKRRSHGEILGAFAAGEADILIGTQMIAKGLDLPNVTLVGVVNADVGIYLPDFRAGERTFQLLTQVAGRAGRGRRAGRVFIQTYSPDHVAIQAAARHDYDAFYRGEIAHRRDLWNPPFSRLTRLTYAGSGAQAARRAAERLAARLRATVAEADRPDLEVLGPAPGFVARLRGKHRWQIIVRGDTPQPILTRCGIPPGWRVDVDPVSLL